jgi:cytochrome P450
VAIEFNPRSTEFHSDPWPVYQRLREEAPVYRQEKLGFWALSRYEDVRNALYTWETYSNQGGVVIGEGSFFKPFLLILDPPDHTRLRRLMVDILTPRRFLELEPVVRAQASRLLEEGLKDGSIDLATDFAARLPMSIIGRLLGVPEEMDQQFIDWGHSIGNIEEDSPEDGRRAVESIQNIYKYYDRTFDERAGQHPKDDVIGKIVELESAGEISRDEAIGFGFLITIAGSETTTRLICNTLHLLETHPDQKSALLDDASLIPGALEEALRFDSPTYLETRTLKHDVELHGESMRAGDQVALLFNSANHDDAQFEDAQAFNIYRQLKPTDHLAFGAGVHACIGVQLARMEARVAFEEILNHMGRYSIDTCRAKHTFSTNQRGWRHLPAYVGSARQNHNE